MKYFIELNEADIVQIIADHFEVSSTNVNLDIEKQTVGYGPMEHDVNVVKVVVEGVSLPGGLKI